jgi:dTDP-4-amino-4,6-dideoxygalactose transaminase
MLNKKIINYKFKKLNPIGREELYAAKRVITSGKLSGFLAGKGPEFEGGKYVKLFEEKIKKYFNVKYAITVNSWTSGLSAIIGALKVKKGDEIILPTWTMSACAAAILQWNAVPKFCDIKEDDFTIDPKKLEKLITKKTVAILAVDLFGTPCDYDEIIKISKKYNIKIISDSAQAISSIYKNKYVSTFVDMGGFSLNRHKHINTGEGGIIITNNKRYAERLKLIRNHAELYNDKKNVEMFGFNFRLGEIESAIGMEQLKKLKKIVKERISVAEMLTSGLKHLKGLNLPTNNPIKKKIYYFYPLTINKEIIKTKREKIISMLKDQGIQEICSEYNSLHKLKIFQNSKSIYQQAKSKKYLVAENLNKDTFMAIKLCNLTLNKKDISLIIKSFENVWNKISFYS